MRVGIVLIADGPGSCMTLLSPSSRMSYPSVPTDIAPERWGSAPRSRVSAWISALRPGGSIIPAKPQTFFLCRGWERWLVCNNFTERKV